MLICACEQKGDRWGDSLFGVRAGFLLDGFRSDILGLLRAVRHRLLLSVLGCLNLHPLLGG